MIGPRVQERVEAPSEVASAVSAAAEAPVAFAEAPRPAVGVPAGRARPDAPADAGTSADDAPEGLPFQGSLSVSVPMAGVAFTGSAACSVTAPSLACRLDSGRAEFSVEPHRGLSVEVTTPEAKVAVVGTVFAVARDDAGTRVSVSRGVVRVTCDVAPPKYVVPGEEVTCAAKSPASLLGRARLRMRQGAHCADVLPMLAAADDLAARPGTTPAVRTEIRLVYAACVGESDPAAGVALLADASAIGPRAEEAARLAAQLAEAAATPTTRLEVTP
jgi:hypothetical protein